MEIMQRVSAEISGAIPAAAYTDFISYVDRPGKTSKSYMVNLRQWAAWTAYNGIQAPTRADIIAYRDYLQREHYSIMWDRESPQGWRYRTDRNGNRIKITCSANTAAQYLRTVKMFFQWASAAGIYPNIAQNIHAPKVSRDHKKMALAVDDVQRIENAIQAQTTEKQAAAGAAHKDTAGRLQRAGEQGKRLHAIYLLSVTAGLRTIEISRANISDIEVIGGTTYLYIFGKGRTAADQKKPLADEVAQAIRDYLSSRSDGAPADAPLFVSTGNRSKGQRIAPETISKMLKRAMQGAGYDSKRITAHSLRHTAGTAAMELTGDLYTVQKYMRHASPVTTEIYLHDNETTKQADTAQEIYNYFHGRRDPLNMSAILAGMTEAQLLQLVRLARATA